MSPISDANNTDIQTIQTVDSQKNKTIDANSSMPGVFFNPAQRLNKSSLEKNEKLGVTTLGHERFKDLSTNLPMDSPFKGKISLSPKGTIDLHTRWDRQLAKTYKSFLDRISENHLKKTGANSPISNGLLSPSSGLGAIELSSVPEIPQLNYEERSNYISPPRPGLTFALGENNRIEKFKKTFGQKTFDKRKLTL